MQFFVGGYTAEGGGSATGIGAVAAGTADATLAGGPLGFRGDAVRVDGSPSWITRHPSLDVVYAALESAGAVQAFRRTGEATLDPLGEPVEVGELACHVGVAPDGGSLIASCWGDGRVVRLILDAEGHPSAPVAGAGAADPYADGVEANGEAPDLDLAAAARALREAAGDEYAHLVPDYDAGDESIPEGVSDPPSRVSRAHQSVFLSNGTIVTTDMGMDLVRFWRVGDRGQVPAQQVVLPLGSGPRHMVAHPSGYLYVLTELSREVFVLGFGHSTGSGGQAPAWRIVAGASLAAGTLDGDTAAELGRSRDGDFLYAGVRGSNTVATLRVRGDGSDLAPVALVDAGVDGPRHHVVARDTLLVAGQHSDEIASMTLDLRTGVPGRVRYRADAPSPTCLIPVR